MKWISVKDQSPKHMQEIKVYVENPYSGSFERNENAVFLWFKGEEQGSFYDSNEQIHLENITHWMPLPKGPKD